MTDKSGLNKIAAGGFDPSLFAGRPLNWAKNFVLDRFLAHDDPRRPSLPRETAHNPGDCARVRADFGTNPPDRLYYLQDWLDWLDASVEVAPPPPPREISEPSTEPAESV